MARARDASTRPVGIGAYSDYNTSLRYASGPSAGERATGYIGVSIIS